MKNIRQINKYVKAVNYIFLTCLLIYQIDNIIMSIS